MTTFRNQTLIDLRNKIEAVESRAHQERTLINAVHEKLKPHPSATDRLLFEMMHAEATARLERSEAELVRLRKEAADSPATEADHRAEALLGRRIDLGERPITGDAEGFMTFMGVAKWWRPRADLSGEQQTKIRARFGVAGPLPRNLWPVKADHLGYTLEGGETFAWDPFTTREVR